MHARHDLPAGLPVAAAVVFRAVAEGLRPPPRMSVADWAQARRIVAPESGSPKPGRWDHATTPYLVEIMEVLSPRHPCREVAFQKCAQVGATAAGENLVGYVIDVEPAPILIVLPSLEEAKKYEKTKLGPMIDATPVLRGKVRMEVSRDEKGSTTSFKRFAGGYCQITGANSSKGLQMISARILLLEEVSEYPADVDNRGDPVGLALARTDAYTDNRKVFYNSTPGIAGACRVSAKYEASDQRRYHVPCPHCGAEQVLHFQSLKWRSETPPQSAYYVCEANGCVIEEWQRDGMVAAGRWIATHAGDGREPGFHLNKLYSPFVTWSDLAGRFLADKDDPAKLKVFVQQNLGEPWEDRGDAPEWKRLLERAQHEPLQLGTVPRHALLLVAGVDVQRDGLYFEVTGYGRDGTSWSVDYGFLTGDTGDETGAVWGELGKLYDRTWSTETGQRRSLDMLAIDAGFNTDQVCGFVRGRPYAMAVKGTDGWNRAVLGEAQKQDVTVGGKRRRRGARIWPVFVWSLKSVLYANLRKQPPLPGDEAWQPGFCHFTATHTEAFFRQLTAEHLKTVKRAGRERLEWTPTGENHYHDCRIYSLAALERAKLRWGVAYDDPSAWARLEAERGTLPIGSGGQAELPIETALAPAPAEPIDTVRAAPRPLTREEREAFWRARRSGQVGRA